jgi:hypothetical protein
MFKWPKYPIFYEINTWVWLFELRQSFGSDIDLGSIPSSVWDAIGGFGFNAVWLMGVWERSPAGTALANRNPDLVETFHRTLPDYTQTTMLDHRTAFVSMLSIPSSEGQRDLQRLAESWRVVACT